ncbi:hypothetical protein N2W54_000389 [Lotmaria passim]
MQQASMMAVSSRTASAASPLKATLTNNPQDSTQIPSLFQTFGQNDVSSGEDDDVEVLVHEADDDYAAAAAAVSCGRSATTATSAARMSPAAHPAAAPLPAARTGAGATASLNASRNRHPLNRSTHNPYVLISSTDGTTWSGPEAASSLSTASTSVTGRQANRYSSSNSTSQNPLTFEFNSFATGGEGNVNSNSPATSVAGGMIQRRQPSQQLPSSEPADGYWRDGNPMAMALSMSNTDNRSIATTTVGTLSTGTTGEPQMINVNLRQRVRPPTSSHASSLSTSEIMMPIIQPMPSSTAAAAAVSVGAPLPHPSSTSKPDNSSFSHASSESTRRGVSLNASGTDRGVPPPPQQQQQQLGGCGGNDPLGAPNSSSRNRMVSVPSSAAVDFEDADERMNPSVVGYQANSPHHTQQQQQPQQPHYEQYQPHALPIPPPPPQLQQYYGYGGQSMSPPHSPYSHSSAGYADQPYPGMPPFPGAYNPPQQPGPLPVPQYHPQQHMAMMQGAAAGGYMSPYGPMVAANANYYMGVPSMLQGYGYSPIIAGMNNFGLAVPQAGYGEVCGLHGDDGGRGQHRPRLQSAASMNAGDAAAAAVTVSPSAQSGASSNNSKSKSAKGKTQDASSEWKSQGKQGNAKKSAGTSSATQADGRAGASNENNQSTSGDNNNNSNASTSGPTTGGANKLAKRRDEARFRANRAAPIQLFVVVKRKMEGQRYACPFPAAEVPIGSHVLVEGDRGADLGEVLAHVSMEQMAHDCALIERRRKAALEKTQEQKFATGAAAAAAGAPNTKENDHTKAEETDLPQLSGQEARDYVLAVRDWPWLIGPATPEDVAGLAPLREAEKQAFATAKPIVQQFIENRYQQRAERNEQALRAAANANTETAPEAATMSRAADGSSDDGERGTSLAPLTTEELQMLELSRQVTLVECEYQFTREKITLFVSRPSRSIFVDFRRMQRKLYRTFRCRIWIAYMDEIADDEDAPESFVFVPPPSSSSAAAAVAEENHPKNA